MESGRSGSDGNASAKPFNRQDVENDRQRRSRLVSILNVPDHGKRAGLDRLRAGRV